MLARTSAMGGEVGTRSSDLSKMPVSNRDEKEEEKGAPGSRRMSPRLASRGMFAWPQSRLSSLLLLLLGVEEGDRQQPGFPCHLITRWIDDNGRDGGWRASLKSNYLMEICCGGEENGLGARMAYLLTRR